MNQMGIWFGALACLYTVGAKHRNPKEFRMFLHRYDKFPDFGRGVSVIKQAWPKTDKSLLCIIR